MSQSVFITLLLVLFALPAPGLRAATPEPSQSPQSSAVAAPAAISPRVIRLRSRIFTPPAGVDPAVAERTADAMKVGGASAINILQLREVPKPETWQRLAASGIAQVSYLGGDNWLVRQTLPARSLARLEEALRAVGATALTPLLPTDKASPALAAGNYQDWAYDRGTGLLKVVVQFFQDIPAPAARELARSFHRGSVAPVVLGPLFWALQIYPADLDTLLASEAVHDVDLGPPPKVLLMDEARWKTGVEEMQNIDLAQAASLYAKGLSGKGVRISTDEGIDRGNDDFWNHGAGGQRTTARWPSATCSPTSDPEGHGTMTAGIALGNGFLSSLRGGAAYQWRGVAPEAVYDCGGTEDVVSRSLVQTWGPYDSAAASIDSQIRGDNGGDLRPQVWAVANQGIDTQGPRYGVEKGYYSVYAPAKNSIAVANLSDATLRWMYSSVGPTWDGRIKPDLGAPGTRELFPDKKQLRFDLDFVTVHLTSGTLTWGFDHNTYPGGWGQHPWWGGQNIGPISQWTEGVTAALSVPILAPPYGLSFQNRPLIGTLTAPDGTTPLNITGAATDRVEIRCRIEADSAWQPANISFFWDVNPDNYDAHSMTFNVVADGNWHTVVLPVGKDPTWKGVSGIDYLYLRFGGGPGMLSAGKGSVYTGASGSSAAAPVVSGAIALLMDQMTQPPFNIQLGNRKASSPFWFGAPGTGVPLPSTFKALLIHGAHDLAYLPHLAEPNNPDTKAPTVYHQGPDLATGYGLIDISESSRVVAAHTANTPYIVERQLSSGQLHNYTITVPPSPRGPLTVTLAWDDPAGDVLWDEVAPDLVNDLNLSLVGPDGIYFPYSIDQPYLPADESQYPSAVEPEPITAADIHPARQDRPNGLDNVEQVYVENPLPGAWTVRVKGFKLIAPPQKYSLILGTPPRPATHLNGGKIVFSSDRVQPPQLFVQQVGSTAAPTQVTRDAFPARHARWSRNGKYIVYITTDVIVGGPGSHQVDKLVVIPETGVPAGTQPMYLLAGKFGATSLGYPQWSDDGRSIVVLFGWLTGERGLGIIHFAAPYQFTFTPVLTTLIHPGQIPNLNPGEPIFSRDGTFVYFAADSSAPGQLYRIPVAGGTPTPVYGNAAPIRRAFAPSLSPDGTRLVYNSEMWKEDPAHYQDEELLEVGLLTGVIQRLTAEPGNQYGFFAKNGSGEMLVQSNNPATGKYDLYLEENGVRVPLDPTSSSNESGDWWKPPCGGAAVLWAGGEAVGCKFTTWSPEQRSFCGSWTSLVPSGNGSCTLCVDAQWVGPVLNGAWSGLTEGPDVATAQPADLSCRACVIPPDKLAGWWPLDELTGTVVADLSASAANGTRVGGATPVAGRVKAGLKLNGLGGYVQIPSSAPLNVDTGNFSLNAWVKIDNPADLGGTRVIADKRQQGPWRGYSFLLFKGGLALQLADGLGSQYSNFLSSVQVPADGSWHLVTVTVGRANPKGGRFYLDGDPVGVPFDPTGRKGTLSNNRPLRLGNLSLVNQGSFFKGSLDEVTLYQRVLTPYEVRILYLAGPFGGCKP